MKLVAIKFGYNFWVGEDETYGKFFNITPIDQEKPNGGHSSSWICRIKNVPNVFKELGLD